MESTKYLAATGLCAFSGTGHSLALMGVDLDAIIPFVAIVGSFFLTVSIIAIFCFTRHQRHKMANDTLRLMIEKGQPITPELVDSLKSKYPRSGVDYSSRDTRKGLILTGIGVGLVVLCGKPGWIVFFIGLAFLAVGVCNVGRHTPDGASDRAFKDPNQPPKL